MVLWFPNSIASATPIVPKALLQQLLQVPELHTLKRVPSRRLSRLQAQNRPWASGRRANKVHGQGRAIELVRVVCIYPRAWLQLYWRALF